MKQEALVIPPLPGEEHEDEVIDEVNNNKDGLEAAFEALRKKARKTEDADPKESEEKVVESFLSSKLEKQNLANWEKYEEKSK